MNTHHPIYRAKVWQDSPEYGCTDNPSYKWYAENPIGDGHVGVAHGPFETQAEAEAAA